MDATDQEQDAIKALFVRMGAPDAQAQVMASQLLKRAGQIAEERSIPVLEAIGNLLRKVIEARQGGGSGSESDF